MTKGHLIFAQNSDIDYVRQAYALALSIKKYNQFNSVCLVTNSEVPQIYKKAFNYIVDIPYGDSSKRSVWKVENRWKLIYASPYEETMVYDSDMLLLESNDHWWELLKDKDVFLTNKVLNYKGQEIKNSTLRKAFIENNLPDVYFGFHYFKKNFKSFEFYKWLEDIIKNYKLYYNKFTPKNTQNFVSMDVSAAIAVKILDAEQDFTLPLSTIAFTHMKKELQGWQNIPHLWADAVLIDYKDKLHISNYLQSGLFHYTENEFLTDKIIKTLENANE